MRMSGDYSSICLDEGWDYVDDNNIVTLSRPGPSKHMYSLKINKEEFISDVSNIAESLKVPLDISKFLRNIVSEEIINQDFDFIKGKVYELALKLIRTKF